MLANRDVAENTPIFLTNASIEKITKQIPANTYSTVGLSHLNA
jgi:hypothetical protein